MFSTDFIFRQQDNLVDDQKCQAGFRPLCNKILLLASGSQSITDSTIVSGMPHWCMPTSEGVKSNSGTENLSLFSLMICSVILSSDGFRPVSSAA